MSRDPPPLVKGKFFDTRFGLIHVQTGKKNFCQGTPPPPRNSKKLLWPCGGRYASCVHAGGLSCTLHCFYLQVVRGHTGGGGGTHSYHHVSSRVTGGSGGVSDYELPLSAHSLGTSSLAGGAGYGGAGAGLGGAGVGRAGAGHHHTPSYHRLPVSHFSHSSLLSLFVSKIKSHQTLFCSFYSTEISSNLIHLCLN